MAATPGHATSCINDFLRRVFKHNSDADHADISDVYNRGNDFYAYFLCNRMLYSVGLFPDSKEEGMDQKIEIAQNNKMSTEVGGCRYLQLAMWGPLFHLSSATPCTT